MTYRILIVEDDTTIAQVVTDHLKTWGWEATCVSDFLHVMESFCAAEPHLVLMDITLPFFNGYHWCGEIRKISKVPIVFLSSASDNMNIVMAMNMGADDFISKPFDLPVLTAKIQAILRRTYDFSVHADFVCVGECMLHLSDHTVWSGDQKAELTKNESGILQVLIENKGKTVSREQLMTALWDSDSFVDDNTLTVNVTRLRKKMDTIGCGAMIQTKKGLGYMVEEK